MMLCGWYFYSDLVTESPRSKHLSVGQWQVMWRPFSYGTFLAATLLLALMVVRVIHALLHIKQQLCQFPPVNTPPGVSCRLVAVVVVASKAPPRLSLLAPVQNVICGHAQVSTACTHLVGFVQVVHAEPVLPGQLGVHAALRLVIQATP